MNLSKEIINIFDLDLIIFAKFYSPKCKFSQITKEEFSKASERLRNIVFLNIDCTNFPEICKKYYICGYPTFLLIKPNGTYITFSKTRVAQEMIDFIEDALCIQNTTYALKPLVKLKNTTYHSFLTAPGCNIVIYIYKWLRFSKAIRRNTFKLSRIFAGDNHVHFGEVDCEIYPTVCHSLGVITINTNNRTIEHTVYDNIDEGVKIVNTYCNTSRQINGHLSLDVGVNQLVENSISSFQQYYAQPNFNASNVHTDEINQSTFIFNVMRNIAFNGSDILLDYQKKLQEMQNKDSISIHKRDDIDIRLNIINVFIKYFFP